MNYDIKTLAAIRYAYGGGPVDDPSIQAGYDWLAENAKAAWDFTSMTGVGFAAAPSSVSDFTGNGHNAITDSGTFTPKVGAYIDENGAVKTFLKGYASGVKDCYVTALPCTPFFNSDFEVHLMMQSGDGRLANNSIWGINDGAARRINIRKTATGFFDVQVNVSGTSWPIFTTTSGQLEDNTTAPVYIRFSVDFTTDTFKFWLNGIERTFTVGGTGALSAQVPAGFNGVRGIGLGAERASATTVTAGGAEANNLFKCAITPLLTNAQAVNVAAWITNI